MLHGIAISSMKICSHQLMSPSLLGILCFLPFSVAGDEISQCPASIETEVSKSGRYALIDSDRDGWDDLWSHLFPLVDKTQVASDDDGDGKTNYEEMLDFTDPRSANLPVRELSLSEINEARKATAEARRASDRNKRQRFHNLLQSKGILKNPRGQNANELETAPQSESSFWNGGTLNSLMLCSIQSPIRPKIIGMERLSNGQFLLAWEGEPDRLYNIEYSDDLVNWKEGARDLPVVGGVGTWGQLSPVPTRFFRVQASELISEIVGAPDGGDGETTFGISLSINGNGETALGVSPSINISNSVYATVSLNLPGDTEPSTVELYVDGEWNAYCEGGDGIYRCAIRQEFITSGTHNVYAVVDASSGTTPGPDNPVGSHTIKLRSSESVFTNASAQLIGAKATEDHIHAGEPNSPTYTNITVEYPYIGVDPNGTSYTFEVRDENGNLVREEAGEADEPGPGLINWEWDGTGDNGTTLPNGPYWVDFFLSVPGDLSLEEPILVRVGPTKLKVLAIGETSGDISVEPNHLLNARPEWWQTIGSSGGTQNTGSGWGPWASLGGGPSAVVGGLQKGIGKHPHGQTAFWLPGNPGNAPKWKNSSPANDFLTGNPFNSYDMGFLIGHGVASGGGTYTNGAGQQVTLPPQHYFPIFANRTTDDTVWIKSGQMAQKFGVGGKLKWMYVVTCNYLRVGVHNNDTHDIYAAMKTAGTLPMDPSLHILGAYTTSCDVDGAMAHAFSKGAMQEDPDDTAMTLVRAWTYARQHSLNSRNKDAKGNPKQIRNARSIYWPECINDTLPGVPHESLTNPTGNGDQSRLKETDSKYP